MSANFRRAIGCAGFAGLLLAAATPAFAQIQALPETSRGEAQVNSLNSEMRSDQQLRGVQQQNQFENNQIRGQIQSAPAPIVVTPPPIVGPRR
jgi:hypothetical protein